MLIIENKKKKKEIKQRNKLRYILIDTLVQLAYNSMIRIIIPYDNELPLLHNK